MKQYRRHLRSLFVTPMYNCSTTQEFCLLLLHSFAFVHSYMPVHLCLSVRLSVCLDCFSSALFSTCLTMFYCRQLTFCSASRSLHVGYSTCYGPLSHTGTYFSFLASSKAYNATSFLRNSIPLWCSGPLR